MNIISEHHLPANSGWGAEMAKDQILRIEGMTIVDFVCLSLRNSDQRFDQSRTKVYNRKLFITVGDVLYSKFDNPMMTIIEDGFAGKGYHDLQFGTCSGPRFARSKAEGRLNQYYDHGEDIPIPDHGCWENLQDGLRPWAVPPEHVPSPLNIFQHVDINTTTGEMQHSPNRPAQPIYVDFRAKMDLVVAASACPDLAAPNFGQPVQATIYEM